MGSQTHIISIFFQFYCAGRITYRAPLDIIVLGILFDQDINLLDIYFYLSVGYPDTNNLDFTYFVRKMALKNFK
jgi:hypothetical protein